MSVCTCGGGRRHPTCEAHPGFTHARPKTRSALARLSPGARSVLLRFEKATRDLAGYRPAGDSPWERQFAYALEAKYRSAKNEVIRKMLRMEGTLSPDGRSRQ